jgi:hypothetical protein
MGIGKGMVISPLIPRGELPAPLPFKGRVMHSDYRTETELLNAGITLLLQGRSQARMQPIPIPVVPAPPLHLPT